MDTAAVPTTSVTGVTSEELGDMIAALDAMDRQMAEDLAWMDWAIARLEAMNPAQIAAMGRFEDLEVAR